VQIMDYTIRPVNVGVFPNFEKSNFVYMHYAGEKIDVPCIMWVVEGGKHPIIIDAGPCSPDRASMLHFPIQRSVKHEPKQALFNLGIDPKEVKQLIVSHLHWDHVGNLNLFPNATIYLQKSELYAAVAPISSQRKTYETQIIGYPPLWLEVFDRMVPIEGDIEIAEGIRVIHLPGHSPGLQGVLVHTAEGDYLIASDAIPLFDNLEGKGCSKYIPNSIHYDLETYFKTFEKIEKLSAIILPGHDFRIFDYCQYPVIRKK
jgi:N-acyl homoserine lactone hydrolase